MPVSAGGWAGGLWAWESFVPGEQISFCKPWLGSNTEHCKDPKSLCLGCVWEAALHPTPCPSLQSWDRNQKRRRHSGQQGGGRQQESQQPLTDLSPTTISILGPYSDSLVPTPKAEESRHGQEGGEKLGDHKKSTAFQLNR